MSQQNATLRPEKKVVFNSQEEDPNKTFQGFASAKSLWPKEVWWKLKEEDDQHAREEKERHNAVSGVPGLQSEPRKPGLPWYTPTDESNKPVGQGSLHSGQH